MINQWDIISSANPDGTKKKSYSVVMDGSRQDALQIARQLQEYIRPKAEPAVVPFIYRFDLENITDEETLNKIRAIVRGMVEQTNQNTATKGKTVSKPQPPAPPIATAKTIELSNLEYSIHQIADSRLARQKKPLPATPEDAEKAAEAHRRQWVSTQTLNRLFGSQDDVENTIQEISDLPPSHAAEAAADKSVAAEETGISVNISDAQTHTSTEDLPKASASVSKGTLLREAAEKSNSQQQAESLQDIFLAETKYDIFVDIGKNKPQTKTAEALTKKPKQTGKITKDMPAKPLPSVTPAQQNAAKPEFDVFAQKLTDQTALLDIDDVANITQRMTAKETEQVSPARTPQAADNAATSIPETSFLQTGTQLDDNVMDPFEQLLAEQSQEEEKTATVNTQTKQPAAQNLPPKQDVAPQKEPPSQTQQTPQPVEPADIPQKSDDAPALKLVTATEDIVPQYGQPQPAAAASDLQKNIPAAAKTEKINPIPTANREITMNENQGEKKPFIPLKRKLPPTQPPAAPRPPKPAAPQAPKPAMPQAPKPAMPQAPRPAMPQPHKPMIQPTAKPAIQPAPLQSMPQPEKLHTMLRRRRLEQNSLEKTTTIDHSIQMPLSELKKHNWPLEVPLVPTYTLENMIISVNRFAHATAISVIENPGRMYNPLVLHGASGTGKTHFLHAIGYALSKKYGQENIFITNGVRLSRGIQRYVMEGNIAKFETFVSSVKALLIDDIHLISINEQNRQHLSKLLNDFIKQHKQIVITSKYPPENLAKLEELLEFKLDSGWISDLKPAHGPSRMRIIQNMLTNNGINITNDDINRFFGHPNMSLGTVSRSIRRVRVLEKLMSENTDPSKHSALAIFDQLLASNGEDQSSLIAQKYINDVQSASVLGNGEWGRIGFFYPQSQSSMMNWMLFALQQRAKELGIPGGPELAVRSSYSTENIISSAFKIANLCDNKKLKGAVILGPNTMSCEPSVRENFYDILTHMLEVMLIRCGVINFEEASAPSTYVKILAELLR